MIGADDETLTYAEEDWYDPEQSEITKNMEPFTMQKRQKAESYLLRNTIHTEMIRGRQKKKVLVELMGLEEIVASKKRTSPLIRRSGWKTDPNLEWKSMTSSNNLTSQSSPICGSLRG